MMVAIVEEAAIQVEIDEIVKGQLPFEERFFVGIFNNTEGFFRDAFSERLSQA